MHDSNQGFGVSYVLDRETWDSVRRIALDRIGVRPFSFAPFRLLDYDCVARYRSLNYYYLYIVCYYQLYTFLL